MASWWVDPMPPREGFTALAAQRLNAVIALDDVSESEFQIVVKRQQVLSALIGIQHGKRTVGVMHANVVSN